MGNEITELCNCEKNKINNEQKEKVINIIINIKFNNYYNLAFKS